MVGLGNYSVSANLFGGVSVVHDLYKDLNGDYENEASFKIKLQKSDWSRMMVALLSLIGIANRLHTFGYLPSNDKRFRCILTCQAYAKEISKDSPEVIAEKLKYIIDFMPYFARSKDNRRNNELMREHEIVKDYYTRYLAKWEAYTNPVLTA